jgi:hypothetical protein
MFYFTTKLLSFSAISAEALTHDHTMEVMLHLAGTLVKMGGAKLPTDSGPVSPFPFQGFLP